MEIEFVVDKKLPTPILFSQMNDWQLCLTLKNLEANSITPSYLRRTFVYHSNNEHEPTLNPATIDIFVLIRHSPTDAVSLGL
jgi:hypothetical protein